MPEHDWVSAHAFYHEGLDRLLLEVTGPLVGELADRELATEFFFIRYWDGGTHVRLRVRPATPAARDGVKSLIQERFTAYFAERPAADAMTAQEYEALSTELAGLERVERQETMFPNNSLAFIPYRREHDRYGHGAAIEAVERHFVESSRIALDLLTASAGHRTTAAAALLLITWFAGTDDPEDVIAYINRGAGKPQWPEADHGAEQHRRLVELAKQMHALASGHAQLSGDGTLLRWARSVATLRESLDTPDVLKVLDICAHMMCNRLGVVLPEEGALRQRAARAVAELVTLRSRA